MPEQKTIPLEEYRMLCVKAFNFDKFCSIMEYADAEYFENTGLQLYELYSQYIRRELKKLREEGRSDG